MVVLALVSVVLLDPAVLVPAELLPPLALALVLPSLAPVGALARVADRRALVVDRLLVTVAVSMLVMLLSTVMVVMMVISCPLSPFVVFFIVVNYLVTSPTVPFALHDCAC